MGKANTRRDKGGKGGKGKGNMWNASHKTARQQELKTAQDRKRPHLEVGPDGCKVCGRRRSRCRTNRGPPGAARDEVEFREDGEGDDEDDDDEDDGDDGEVNDLR